MGAHINVMIMIMQVEAKMDKMPLIWMLAPVWLQKSAGSVTLLLGVCDKHQVISKEKLSWHTSEELMRERFQHQDEEQQAKDAHHTPRQTPHCTDH